MDKLIFHDGCHFEFLTLSERLDMPVSTFSLAFGVLCESHDGTHKPFFFPTKLSLKMGSTILFTHLKIISLQCFQFSVINDIQTNPKIEIFLQEGLLLLLLLLLSSNRCWV